MTELEIIKTKKLMISAKKMANNSLKHFFELLGYDPEIFAHLYKLPLKISSNTGACALYDIDENTIYIDKDYLMKVLSKFENEPGEKEILNMANNIIHEMLHANRSIIINNGVSSTNLDLLMDDERERYKQERKGFDVEKYDKYLSTVLNETDQSRYKEYIPVRISINKDKKINVVAYNTETKDYELYYNVDMNLFELDKDFQYTVAAFLDTHKLNPSEVFYSFKFDEENFELASDYYEGELIENRPEGLTDREYSNRLDDRQYNIQRHLREKRSLEEILTETMANIIMTARDDDKINVGVLCQKVRSADHRTQDVKAGTNIIEYGGIKLIDWFLTSAYQDHYEDFIKILFGDNYDFILKYADSLYSSTINGEIASQIAYKNIEDLTINKERGI